MAKLIAIASEKGGVGKTTALLNLGTALNAFGKNTLVVDANLITPSLSLHLGVAHIFPTISEVLNEETMLSEAIFQHQSGLYVIAANLNNSQKTPEWGKVTERLKTAADIVLFDTSVKIDPHLLENLDGAIVITTPDLPAVAATLKTCAELKEKNIPILGAIVNRVNNDNLEMDIFEIRNMLEVPLLGIVPEDTHIKKSLKLAHPVVHTHPDAPSSISFKKIAAHLLGQTYEIGLQPKKQNWYKWFTKT